MQILQLSDAHLRGDGSLSFGIVDTRHCLRVAVEYLQKMPRKPDVIVITGDLADCGDLRAYVALRNAFLPLGLPVYAVPGNHDQRDRMHDIVGEWCPADPDIAPYICYAVEAGPMRMVMIDSMQPGSHSGHCPDLVLGWLRRTLAEQPERPTLLFMHHPPFLAGMGAMDEPFENLEGLAAVIRNNRQVRLCCGHMHRPLFTMWQGCFAATAPSIAMQIELDLSESGGDEFRMETPGYLLHHWHEGACNTHACQIYTPTDFAGPYRFVGKVSNVAQTE